MEKYGAPVMLVALATLVAILLYRWQHNHPKFDLSDLLTGDNGRVSLAKFGQTAALVVSTWGFAVLIQQGKLTESYFIGYMTVWAGYRLAQDAIGKKTGPKDELPRHDTEVSPASGNTSLDYPAGKDGMGQ